MVGGFRSSRSSLSANYLYWPIARRLSGKFGLYHCSKILSISSVTHKVTLSNPCHYHNRKGKRRWILNKNLRTALIIGGIALCVLIVLLLVLGPRFGGWSGGWRTIGLEMMGSFGGMGLMSLAGNSSWDSSSGR